MKKLLLFPLALCLLASGASAQTWNIGSPTATDVTATLNSGVLTISGTGAMQDYTYNTFPWYNNRQQITSVVIGSGVTSIGSYAFNGCYYVTSVTIGNSVTSIGSYAFQDCFSVTSLTIGSSVTSIGNYAFRQCQSLTEINIPNSVTSIGNNAFAWCSSLTEITIPNSITSISNSTFSVCQNLTSVTIGSNVTSIGTEAFISCQNLTTVTSLNPNPPTLSDNPFSYTPATLCLWVPEAALDAYMGNTDWSSSFTCFNGSCMLQLTWSAGTNLTATFRCGVLTISGTGAMTNYANASSVPWNNYSLKISQIVVDNGVTSIGSYAFNGCYYVTSVTIGNSVTSIGNYAFQDCFSVTSLTIGSSVTSIGDYAFESHYNITSVTIPNSVTSIGSYAFRYCYNLTSVTIGSSVTSIGSYAFSECWNIATIISLKPAPPPTAASTSFTDIPETCCVYVPSGSENAYRTASYWNRFAGCIPTSIFHTVTFNAMGGNSTPTTQTVLRNSLVTRPTDPTREGYVLLGWYTAANYATEWDFNTPITANITLYAKWVAVYTVTFNAMNGVPMPPQQVFSGEKAAMPHTPIREGYTLIGWYADTSHAAKWDFNTPITENITLFARWVRDIDNYRCTEGTQFVIKIPFRQLPPSDTVTYRWYRNNEFFSDGVATAEDTHIICTIPPNEAYGINVVFYFEYWLNDGFCDEWTPSPKYKISFLP